MSTIDQPKAVLLNFTADVYHWGCYGTSMEILHTLLESGYYVDPISVFATHHLNPTPANSDQFSDPRFFDSFAKQNPAVFFALDAADLVVINGEGTLHRISKGSVNLLYMAMAVKRFLKKPVHLINHSCFPNGDLTLPEEKSLVYSMVLPQLDYVVPREIFSHELLKASSVPNTLGFDCLPRFINRHGLASSHQPGNYVLLSGGIALSPESVESIANLANQLYTKGISVRFLVGAKSRPAPDDVKRFKALSELAPHIELVTAPTMEEWLSQIRHAAILISGRFHHTIAALTIGTPYVVFGSNTPKVEAILKTLSEPDSVLLQDNFDMEGLLSRIASCLENKESNISTQRVDRMLELGGKNFEAIVDLGRVRSQQEPREMETAKSLREQFAHRLRQKVKTPVQKEDQNPCTGRGMIRIKNGEQNGATAFFRNRALLKTLESCIDQLPEEKVHVKVHACSVGAEPYSLIINHLASRVGAPRGLYPRIKVTASDVNPEFLDLTRKASYSLSLLSAFSDDEKQYVDILREDGTFTISDEAMKYIEIVGPESVLDSSPNDSYQITIMNNVLCYLAPDDQRKAIALAAKSTTEYLVLTAFDPDTIMRNIVEVGFEPVLENHEAIHYGWKDRARGQVPKPGTPAYFWMLGKYDAGREDYLYRYGTVFKKLKS